MTRFELPLYASLALGAGPWMFWRSFRDLHTRRLIQNTPTARIRSMAMGLVEVSGTVEARSRVEAPFSGRTCAYWEVDVSARARREGWNVVHRSASGHPFFLSDDTGTALVYPAGARCTLQHGVEESCAGLVLPPCYAEYLEGQGLGLAPWRLGMLRFRERVLEEGQRVYVLGTATPRSLARAVSDADDLEATGTDGAPVARLRELDGRTSGVIRRGVHETTFIISQQSERDLALGLGLRAWAGLLGGPALALLGLGFWLHALRTGSVFR